MTSIDQDVVREQSELLYSRVPAAAAAKTSLNSSWITTRHELRDEQAARTCEKLGERLRRIPQSMVRDRQP
jgi:hypothetical protein